MNLILTELLVTLYGIPVDFIASLQDGWKMGRAVCRATGFILTTLGEMLWGTETVVSLIPHNYVRERSSIT